MTRKQRRQSRPQSRPQCVSTHRPILRQLIVLCLSTLLCASIARAHSFVSNWLAFFPSDVSEFGYVDLSEARSFSSYLQIRAQPASVNSLEQFLSLPMMGEGSEVDEAIWAVASREDRAQQSEVASGRIMGLAFGHFHPETVAAFLSDRMVPSENLGEYTVYPTVDFDHDPAYAPPADGTIWFVFLDSNTVAFGSRGLLQRMLSAHEGNEADLSENVTMLALIDRAETDGIFWGVFDADATRTVIRQLVPKVTAFSGASQLIGTLSTLQVNIDASFPSSLEINLQAEAGSPSVAWSIAQLLARATQQRSQAAKDDNPDLADFLNTARIYSIGSHVLITLTPTNDQVLFGLLDHDNFIPKE